MREKVFIILSIILILVVLIGLNAASYTKQNKLPDSEFTPNRSTFNSDSTGTRAFYDLLAETGRKVTRWQEKPAFLLSNTKNKPSIFVIVGLTRSEISDDEVKQILEWTAAGGRLILVDREPNKKFFEGSHEWKFKVNNDTKFINLDIDNQVEMTAQTAAIKPIQPSVYSREVIAVQPSLFASSIKFEYLGGSQNYKIDDGSAISAEDEDYYGDDENYDQEPPPAIKPTPNAKLQGQPPPIVIKPTPEKIPKPAKDFGKPKPTPAPTYSEYSFAPVVHFADKDRTLLVDYKYGSGEIILLSEPYIIANNGISLVDNAQLGINLVASKDGLIAFDEYHQGYGKSENNLWTYFNDTPVQSIFWQIILVIGLIFFAQSRRFARPLPSNEKNRLSKLEYVSAMAELQQSTKAFDLAIENVYLQFKRSLIRFSGADNSIKHKDLANIISERSKINAIELYNLLNQCQSIIHGEPTNKKEVLRLTKQIREMEESLGLKRNKNR